MSATPRPAPNMCSPIAPALASFSTWTGIPSRCSSSSAGSTPSQPGMMPPVSTRPVAASTGAAKPTPTPIRRSPPTPASATASAVSRCAASSIATGSPSISIGVQRSATIPPPRSQTAARRWRWPNSRPTAKAAPRGERDLQRRAALRAPLVGVLGLLLDDPGVLELGQQRGDGRARDAERAPEVAAAARGTPQQRLQQPEPVRLPGVGPDDVVHKRGGIVPIADACNRDGGCGPAVPRPPVPRYGVVVDSVNVSVFA